MTTLNFNQQLWFSSYIENKILGFSGGSVVKNCPPVNARDVGLIPGEGNDNPLQYPCLGTSHGQRSLVGFSPWGCKRVGHNLVTKQQQTKYSEVKKVVWFNKNIKQISRPRLYRYNNDDEVLFEWPLMNTALVSVKWSDI